MHSRTTAYIAGLIACLGAVACEDKPPTDLAPAATALEQTKPKVQGASTFEIVSKGSAVDFTMDAPMEKIRGRLPDATTGSISVDMMDITKTTGHLKVDIGSLEIFQRKPDDKGAFGDEIKHAKQNEHARNWLQIGEKTDSVAREKNSRVEFSIKSVEADIKDVTKLSGSERKLTATVTGDFLLHQHRSVKTAKVEITVKMDGDKPVSVRIKSLEPFAVGLAEHDVRPRDALGKLAQMTLDMMINDTKKVAKEALVDVDFTANFRSASPKVGLRTE